MTRWRLQTQKTLVWEQIGLELPEATVSFSVLQKKTTRWRDKTETE